MTDLANPFIKLSAWWAEREPRERAMFLVMTVIVGIAVAWSLWSWRQAEHVKLAKSLPLVQARLAAMRDEAAEIQRLQRQPALPAIEAGKLAETLEAGAKARGLQIKVQANADGPRLSGTAAFDALTDWLAQVQRDHGARVSRLTITREGQLVRFEGELAPVQPH